MITDIMDGISNKLNQAFGDGFRIHYSKDVRQGLKEPCFFIALLDSSRTRRIGLRYQQMSSFDVHYFPAEKRSNAEMISVAERLFESLELVELLNGDLIRGTEMRYEIQDGVLHFFVDFNVFLVRESDEDNMDELLTNITT